MENWRKHLKEAAEVPYRPLSNEQIFELAGLDERQIDLMNRYYRDPSTYFEFGHELMSSTINRLYEYFAFEARDILKLERGSEAEIQEWMPTWIANDGDPYEWILNRMQGRDMSAYWPDHLLNRGSTEVSPAPFNFKAN
tara:strand:+ start:37 stop:453 length:417 start_codon:yes stop_codon:yes gene_type:complete